MRTHPTFYVGRLRPYHQYAVSSADGFDYPFEESVKYISGHEPDSHVESGDSRDGFADPQNRDELTKAHHGERDISARTPTWSTHSSNGLPTVRSDGPAPSALTSDGDHVRDRGLPQFLEVAVEFLDLRL